MSVKINNIHGEIIISSDVIAKIAGNAACHCYGVVGMAYRSKRDGIASLLKKDSENKGVNITVDEENNISIDLHIITEYGVNISTISNNIISEVKYLVENSTNLTVSSVKVIVESIRVD